MRVRRQWTGIILGYVRGDEVGRGLPSLINPQLTDNPLSCAYQKLSGVSSLTSSWTTVWQIMSRNMTTASMCRAACHAMDALLKLGLIQYASVAEHADGMISSVELNGPAVFADSSSSLWATLLRLKVSESPGVFSVTSERILQWLFSKWTPRKCIVMFS